MTLPNPSDLMYTKDHEWAKIEGDVATVGITDHAQSQLGDIVFVEMPPVGKSFEIGKAAGTIESVKAVSEIFAPVAGEIVETNSALDGDPSLVNADPYGAGWLFKFKLSAQPSGLLSAAEYDAFAAT